MAISYSVLTQSYSTTDAASYNTASITIPYSTMTMVFVSQIHASTTPTEPTLTGNGITWSKINSSVIQSRRRVSIFKGISSNPSAGAITIAMGGQTQTSCAWGVVSFPSAKENIFEQQSAYDYSDSAVTTRTVNLGAFTNTKNATLGVFWLDNGDKTLTAGSGFTKIVDQRSGDCYHLAVEFKDTNDTSVDMTVGSARRFNGAAFELNHKLFTPKVMVV